MRGSLTRVRIRWDAPIGGHVGTVIAAGLLAFFCFQTSLQIRLDLYGRTTPATLLEGHHGRGGSCTYAYRAGSESRTLTGQCYWAPSPAVDYLPGDPGLARSHGQPNLEIDAGFVVAGLALLVASLWHLRKQRR